MVNIDPQQELFTALKLNIEKLGYAVYDGCLPPEGTPYPFVYMGNFRQSDTSYKNAVKCKVYLTLHIWHNHKQRGTVSEMLLNLKRVIYQTQRTKSYGWAVDAVSSDIMPDKTTKEPLLHGFVDAEVHIL